MSLLDSINEPAQLRAQAATALPAVCDELRAFVLDSVSKTGGHLSSNLGVVELTVALHYCFDTPHDRLVWDVGHQCYPHKVLTGRRERMHTLRQWGGLAGFPKRDESPYDTFGVAHSSTSISAALGMAVAAKAKGEQRRVVAIIGDGSMTAGMAFEALNNAGAMDANLLVILNDNEMSISEPVGALNNYLSRLLASKTYGKVRSVGKSVLSALPPVSRFARRWEEHMKGMVLPGTMWEEFGFNYIGPIDGHDVNLLVDTLNKVKDRPGPQFLHVLTRKGAGYERAEDDPILYHGVGKFDHAVGIAPPDAAKVPKKTYSDIFGDWLCDAVATDQSIVGITPAMREGSGMVRFSKEHPDNYFDVGIAEQHSVTFAAGLACEGMKPVVAIYSTFLQRAYDQLVHDVVLQNLPVVLAIDRAGLVGADGPTHAGSFDVAYLRCLPNMTIMSASDAAECRAMLSHAIKLASPVAVRYPRGAAHGAPDAIIAPLQHGKGVVVRRGDAGVRVAILAWGSMLHPALTAADTLGATVANMRFVKPLDEALIRELATSHDLLVTVEEAAVEGGAGSAVAECLAAAGLPVPLLTLGLPDHFIEQGDPAMMLASVGLDAAGVEARIRQRLASLSGQG